MTRTQPQIIVLGGPNGAGKSTSATEVLPVHLGVSVFVNADVIARGLAAFDTASALIAAGRLMLGRIRELAASRASFALETTLASRSLAPWIAGLRASGYAFHLYYLWLNSPALAVARVHARHQSGGHLVSAVDVRRRYVRSAVNFLNSFKPLATTWRVYDNLGSTGPILVADGGTDRVDIIHEPAIWSRFRSVADEAAES